jgi:hypothetical protein
MLGKENITITVETVPKLDSELAELLIAHIWAENAETLVESDHRKNKGAVRRAAEHPQNNDRTLN